jgi:hypothetical protein
MAAWDQLYVDSSCGTVSPAELFVTNAIYELPLHTENGDLT